MSAAKSGGISGVEELEAFAADLEEVAKFGEDAAEICATSIGENARASYLASQSPDGESWKPRKKDGKPALANAPDHVTFHAIGDGIYQNAPDHYKYHRVGNEKLPKRNVYAEGHTMTPAWREAAEKALEREYARRVR